jgi:hypothetical protein
MLLKGVSGESVLKVPATGYTQGWGESEHGIHQRGNSKTGNIVAGLHRGLRWRWQFGMSHRSAYQQPNTTGRPMYDPKDLLKCNYSARNQGKKSCIFWIKYAKFNKIFTIFNCTKFASKISNVNKLRDWVLKFITDSGKGYIFSYGLA